MAEGHCGDAAEVVAGDLRGGFAGGKGAGGAEEGQLTPHTVRAKRDTECGAVFEDRAGGFHLGERGAGLEDGGAQVGFGGAVAGGEGVGVGLIGLTPKHHFDAGGDVAGGADFDGEAEAVEELGAEVAFLGVAGADEDEAGGVADREAVTLDHVFTGLGDVEEEVDDVVFEEVHFVDVEVTPVGAGQKAGLEGLDPLRDGAFDVEGSGDAVFGDAEGQVDDGGGFLDHGRVGDAGPIGTLRGICAVHRTGSDSADGRQEGGKAPNGGMLTGDVVRSDRETPLANAKLVFVSAKDLNAREYVTADDFGGFDVKLPAGEWHLYVGSGNGKATYHSKVSVADGERTTVKVQDR